MALLRALVVGTVASLGQDHQLERVEVLAERVPGVQAGLEGGPGVRLAPQSKDLQIPFVRIIVVGNGVVCGR